MNLPSLIQTHHLVSATVDFYYPQIACMENPIIERKINKEIYNLLLSMIPELTQLDITTYITGYYEIKTNERGILSFILTGMGEFHGAHPINVIRGMNIDTVTGKVYELKELFRPDSNYVMKLTAIGYEQLKKQGTALYDGRFKEIRTDQDYYIADKNLIIFFQQYEIGPRQSGFPYFSVPIYDIEDLIKENGILERLLPF